MNLVTPGPNKIKYFRKEFLYLLLLQFQLFSICLEVLVKFLTSFFISLLSLPHDRRVDLVSGEGLLSSLEGCFLTVPSLAFEGTN